MSEEEEVVRGARTLAQTPTWAVGLVCAVIVIISILLEKALHGVEHYFRRRQKIPLVEALLKIKGELMLLGFISLLLTFGQSYIARICIPEDLGNSMLPCKDEGHENSNNENHDHEYHQETNLMHEGKGEDEGGHRKLLWNEHRMLSGLRSITHKCDEGHLPLISVDGVHQLHIFIFFLAVFHVIYSAITMFLGRSKLRSWRHWEEEAAALDDRGHDHASFRLSHETSFVRDHTSFWTKSTILFYIACFFRQFFSSIRKADYLTMRHGFISVHLSPGSKFDFRKYIKRSLEDDFKVIVGISPLLWTSAVIYLTLNYEGWKAMFWLSVFPLISILVIGTKLQAIISEMAIEITERHAVVQGIPLVKVSNRFFWFHSPKLLLHLIHLTLFQNAFDITYFLWIWYEFGLRSCFHSDIYVQYLRVCIGIEVLILCSYITLPLYALVAQMGSTMKKSIFDQQTTKALKLWHKNAQKKMTEGKTAPPVRKYTPPDSPHDSSSHKLRVAHASSVDIPEQRTYFNYDMPPGGGY